MPATLKPYLGSYLRAVSDDALFLLCSTQKADHETLVEMATRRASHYAKLVQGGTPDSAEWPTWLVNMCVALAPVAPPAWLPMHELIDSLTLEYVVRSPGNEPRADTTGGASGEARSDRERHRLARRSSRRALARDGVRAGPTCVGSASGRTVDIPSRRQPCVQRIAKVGASIRSPPH